MTLILLIPLAALWSVDQSHFQLPDYVISALNCEKVGLWI